MNNPTPHAPPAPGVARDRQLDATTTAESEAVHVTGNPDAWVCLCKASRPGSWMKTTKAFETPSGCVLQVTTLEISADGTRRPAEALEYMPGVSMKVLQKVFG
jgi:hypothetical protein